MLAEMLECSVAHIGWGYASISRSVMLADIWYVRRREFEHRFGNHFQTRRNV